MRRDLAIVGILSIIFTILGELIAQTTIVPTPLSDKGQEIRHAFDTLVMFAIPVFVVVVVTLVYSVVQYRNRGLPERDGPAQFGRGSIPFVWFGVTSSLAVLLMVYPGLTSLPGIVNVATHPDLDVQVQGMQWAWMVTYPRYRVTTRAELVLPVDRTVRFEITSADVVHSFWIPAFMMRIDAVPGMTTRLSLRPTQTGSYATNSNLRLQCSQLCGLGHTVMVMPVRVVSGAEFDAWIQQQPKTAQASAGPATPQPETAQIAGGGMK